MHLGLSISPIAQVKKPRCSPLHLRFLTRALEEISCAICTTYFSTVPKKGWVKMTYNCLIIDDEKLLADSTAEYYFPSDLLLRYERNGAVGTAHRPCRDCVEYS